MMFFRTKKKARRKIYCKDCVHVWRVDLCRHPEIAAFEDTPYERVIVPCPIKTINKNNDCSYFKKRKETS